MWEPYKRNKRILKEIEGTPTLLGGVWSLVRIQSPRLVKKRFRSHFLERFLLSMRVTFLGTILHFYAQKREKNVRR